MTKVYFTNNTFLFLCIDVKYIKKQYEKAIKIIKNNNFKPDFENLERLVDNSSPNQDLTKTEYEKLLAENEIIIYRNGIEKKISYNDSVYYMIYEDDVNFEAPDFSQTAVTLKEDYHPYNPIVITSEVNVNLNEKTIIGPVFKEHGGEVTSGNTDSYGFWVKENGVLTIEGDGEVIAQDAKYSMAVWNNGGTVYIKNGTFRNSGDSCDLIYVLAGGRVEIYGGEFVAHGPAPGKELGTKNPYTALNIKDRDRENSSIAVFGGRFFKFNPADNLSEGEHTNFVAPGYKVVEDGDWFVVMPE